MKMVNVEKDILSVWDASLLLGTNKDMIRSLINNGFIIYIGNIRSLKNCFIFKRDLINYAEQNGIDIPCKNYSLGYTDIFQNYPDILTADHIKEIFDLFKSGNVFYICQNNIDLPYSIDDKGNIFIKKNLFINYLILHRRNGMYDRRFMKNYINDPMVNIERSNGFIFPENYIFNENDEILPGFKPRNPFSDINDDNIKW